ncbi:MAG: NADH-quinone oxidoreductase subunit L [Dehalococcoidia bacterium]|nr:NADH-quinone oxidoreductase subunit L [Dehalococcoidia bacterium]
MDLAELAWLIPSLSFVAFFLIVLFGRFLPGQGAFVAILAIAAGFAMFWVVLGGFLGAECPDSFGQKTCTFNREWFTAGSVVLSWGIIIDPLTVVMLGLVTLVALMVQVYSLGYMHGESRFGWYFAVHALFVASMLALVLADNFLLLYVVWELVGVCSYLLIGFWYERRSAAEAAKKAFITTRIGDVGLLLGILLLFKEVGTFDMSTTFAAVSAGEIGEGTLTAAALLLFLGAMGKSAQFPFHVWLPDAMEGPTPVSALIHAATMVVAGVYLVARAFPIFEAAPDALIVVAAIGLITALMGATMALVVTDLKRILAYSTISHLGLMMLSLGAFGYTAAIFHHLAHGFSKALLFLGAGSVMHSMNNETDINKMGGLRRVMPITTLTFTVGALSLAGIPIFAGFWSKDEVLLAVLDHKNYLLAFALIAAFLSAMYMARALYVVFYGELKAENNHVHESPWVMLAPMAVLAVLAVIFGFVAIRITEAGGIGTFLFFNYPHGFEFNTGLGVGSIILAVGAFVLGWYIYMARRISLGPWKVRFAAAIRVVGNKYYLDDLYQWGVDRVVMAFSRFVALFDRVVINDKAVNGPGESVRRSGLNLRYHVTGRMYNYAMGMAVGAVAIAILWWVLTTST